ncbi:MAG: gliding motility-associated C-terminal domain-containing protein [Saprospiraceae bacterium]|nr:gliding motility-associated C-terminal domain-containing protein [Saprospiraceae bacterium]HRG69552.1 gliding motility-associated C-terminal domain-containing protein [Saprospiraceae bacterium]
MKSLFFSILWAWPILVYTQQFKITSAFNNFNYEVPCIVQSFYCPSNSSIASFNETYAYNSNSNYIAGYTFRDSISFYQFNTDSCLINRLGVFYLPDFRGITFYYIDYLGRIYVFGYHSKSKLSVLYRLSDFNGTNVEKLIEFTDKNDRISDLTIIKDKVYALNFAQQLIYECDTNFQIVKKSYTSRTIKTFSTIPINCDSVVTFCVGISCPVDLFRDSLGSVHDDTLVIFTYDLTKNEMIDSLCSIKMDSYQVWNAFISSREEFLTSDPECDLLIDLDRNNSSGLYPYDFDAHQNICNAGMIPICDGDVYIHTSFYMDSMRFIVRGILDAGMEHLKLVNGPPGYRLYQRSDSSYALIPGPDHSDSNYILALKNIFYQNSSPIAQSGPRQILMQGYNVVKAGVWVSSYLKVGHKPFSGRDTSIVICEANILSDASIILSGSQNGGWWSPQFVSGTNLFDISIDTLGSYQYITQDAYCGSDTAQLAVHKGRSVLLDLGPDHYLCKGDRVWIDLQDSLLMDVEWSDGQTSKQRYIQAPGIFKIKVNSIDGCVSTDSIELKLSGQLYLRTAIDSVCPFKDYNYKGKNYQVGQTIQDTIYNITGCDSLILINLLERSSPQKRTILQTCENKKISYKGIDFNAGDTAVLSIASNQSCDTIEYIRVDKLSNPQIKISGDTLLCEGLKTILQSNVSTTYKWSTGANSQQIEVTQPGQYSLTLTNENDCESYGVITIRKAPEATYQLNSYPPICSGEQNGIIEIKNPSKIPAIVKYELNTKIQANGLYNNLNAGVYYLKLLDENGCEYLDTIALKDPPVWSISLPSQIQLEKGESRQIIIKIDSITIKEIKFDPEDGIGKLNDSVFVITGNHTTQYLIKVTDEIGCEKQYVLQLVVIDNNSVYVPTSFSPNGDGINDWYYPQSRESKQLTNFQIFDRWGNRVYNKSNIKTNEETEGWNGRINNQLAGVGVYVCYMEWLNPDGSFVKKTYDLTLVR